MQEDVTGLVFASAYVRLALRVTFVAEVPIILCCPRELTFANYFQVRTNYPLFSITSQIIATKTISPLNTLAVSLDRFSGGNEFEIYGF